MSSKIINLALDENIIEFASDYLLKADGKTAVLCGNKRPFLFVKKALAQKKQKAFYSPSFLTSDDFIENIVFEKTKYSPLTDLEGAYFIYDIAKTLKLSFLKNDAVFSSFFSWALEILKFIGQLDLEMVSQEAMLNIKANADIGYDAPENINQLLKSLFEMRDAFHDKLRSLNLAQRGFAFWEAAKMDGKTLAQGYDEIILLAPFYLHKSELEIFKKIFDLGKLTIILRGNPKEYDCLKKIYDYFKRQPPNIKIERKEIDFEITQAFDDQSQALAVRNLLKNIAPQDLDKTLIAIADETMLSCMIAEIMPTVKDFNVSAGYPISKTALFALVKDILNAQLSRQDGSYYVKDMMKVLTNPIVKNMRFFGAADFTRAAVHGIERSFNPYLEDTLSGKSFIGLEELSSNKVVLKEIGAISAQMDKRIIDEKIKKELLKIFECLFIDWENLKTVKEFSQVLLSFIERVLKTSIVDSYQLNAQCAQALISTAKELQVGEVCEVEFSQENLVNIFLNLVESKKIPLPGSPLKGLQILGFLEARNLHFENIIAVSMIDSVLPAISKSSPLIPKDISFALGIEMPKKEIEIQKYNFDALIAGAKKVCFVYPDNEKDARSRFIEKLIWDKQFEKKDLSVVEIKKLDLPALVGQNKTKKKYSKTQEIKEALQAMTYSYSCLNTYLRCKLQFYFSYVLGLRENIEMGDEPTVKDIGIFIHNFLQAAFTDGLESSEIKSARFIEEAMKKLDELFEKSLSLNLREDAFLVKRVIEHRIKRLLEYEKTRNFERVFACEKEYLGTIKTAQRQYNLKCRIDRIDEAMDGFIIMDYKTGSAANPITMKNFDKMRALNFPRESLKKTLSLQLPFYKFLFEQNEKKTVSNCAICGVKDGSLKSFAKESEHFQEISQGSIEVIKALLDEINDGDYFEFDENDSGACAKCEYFYLCG
jgi:CRISPR/Cas system-associated exonuclease Cas4 (RecB family)